MRSPAARGSWLGTRPGYVRAVLVEDDEGDAFLVQELLAEVGAPVQVEWVRTLADATARITADTDCVLLDLGLPDAEGMDVLTSILAIAPHAAVLVLTGLDDEHEGAAAVGSGAQDYLVKGQVDGQLLARSIRYAIGRKHADESLRRLYESELRAAENARLERGLLPHPLTQHDGLESVTRYRPGRHQALLGGDFYDIVECPDKKVFAVIGDVAGHGPDEAALGVCLRIAWRTLILAGHEPAAILPALQVVLVSERRSEEVFATVAMIQLAASRRSVRLWLAGHPAPLHIDAAHVERVTDDAVGPALGVVDDTTWPSIDVRVGPDSWLMLYTDGLIEGHVGSGPGRDRLGDDGLLALVRAARPSARRPSALADEVLRRVQTLNGGELLDDVAVVLLAWLDGLPAR